MSCLLGVRETLRVLTATSPNCSSWRARRLYGQSLKVLFSQMLLTTAQPCRMKHEMWDNKRVIEELQLCMNLMFVDPCTIVQFLQWKAQQYATVYQNFIVPYFKLSSTCFGRHTAHHQEPKIAQAASSFAYVEGCRTCSCWTLSGSVSYMTTSNNCTSDNLARMQNQRLLVQF